MALGSFAIGAGVVAAVIAAAPLMALPSTQTVTRSALIDADVSTVYQTLSSTAGFQTFNPYRDSDPDLTIEPFGPEAGIGAGFRFSGKEGTGTQTIVAQEENRSVTMQIDLGAMGKPTQTFVLAPQDGQTLVSWSVQSDFGFNPVFRVFGLFMDRMFGPIYERGLQTMQQTAIAGA